MPITTPSRWTDIPELREECAKLLKRNLNSGDIADALNKKFGAQMRKLGYDALNRNMIIGEKHRERIKERRNSGQGVTTRRKGKRVYLTKAIVEVEPKRVPYAWMNNPIHDAVRIKSRLDAVEPKLEDEE